MSRASEQIIFDELKSGSETAFKKVYEDNREKFLNFATKYELTQDELIDVYQDAYIVFHENILTGKLESLTSTLGTYLFSIGKFMIMDRLRKENKTVRSDRVLEIIREEEIELDDLEMDIEELTSRQRLLAMFFKELGEQCQKILTLFYYRGLTIDEIMNVGNYNNKNVVKSQKSRCLKTLRDKMKNSPN